MPTAVGPDEAWYVSELKGFPETVGAARIWRVEPGTSDHDCDASATSGPCRVVASGFTNVIDTAFGPDGTLYVLEIAKDGLNDFFFTGTEPIGALWALKDGVKTLVNVNCRPRAALRLAARSRT